jgi:non-ribosomal peptide synthetase component F
MVGLSRTRPPGGEADAARLTLPGLFERQVARAPDAVAVVCEGTRLSYAELNARANRLARFLLGLGAGPERLVAIAMPRSAEMIVAVLAVLKTGAGYAPVDPSYPQDWVAYMLADARPVTIVTTTQAARDLPGGTPRVVLDDPAVIAVLSRQADDDLAGRLRPANPAYVIYTSGSTGRPKGVVVSHRNVTRLLGSTRGWFGFGPGDVWALFHSYAFDFSVWEMWGALGFGGRLVVVPFLVSRSAGKFRELLSAEGVTVLNQVPSAFYQLMEVWGDGSGLGGAGGGVRG